jgi:GH25 family lysozyme M1 (1,4-beta-N-acetylmuramidase)/biotin carboxyl carrier protein
MAIKGVDIASHQGPDFAYPDWAEFAVIKATGGHSYANEHLHAQMRHARARGMEVGFYHYMFEGSYGTPQTPSGGDVLREANNFIQAVELVRQPGDTLWLDVEEYGKTVGYTGYLGDWCVQFCDMVGAHFGCMVGIYTATWFLLPNGMQGDTRLTRYPLWFASWQDEPPAPVYLKPWTGMSMWQFNADGVDKDLFYGSRADWRALGIPGDVAPPPPPGNEIIPHVLADGRPAVTIAFAGKTDTILGVDVADLGISVMSATEQGVVLDQSVQGNAFGGWRVRAVEPAPVPEPPPPPSPSAPPEPAPAPAPQPQPEPEVPPMPRIRLKTIEDNQQGRAGTQVLSPYTGQVHYVTLEHGALHVRHYDGHDLGQAEAVEIAVLQITAHFANPGQVCVTLGGFTPDTRDSVLDTRLIDVKE